MNPLEKKGPLAVPPPDYKDPSERAGAEQNKLTLEELQEGADLEGKPAEYAWAKEQNAEVDKLFNSVSSLENPKEVKDKLREIYDRSGKDEKAALLGMLSEVKSRMRDMGESGSTHMVDLYGGVEDFLKGTITQQMEGDVVSSSPAPEALQDIDDQTMPISSPGRNTQVNIPVPGSPASTRVQEDFFKAGDEIDAENRKTLDKQKKDQEELDSL